MAKREQVAKSDVSPQTQSLIRSMAVVQDLTPTNQLANPPQNLIARLTGAVKGFVNGWLGPGSPISPVAPPGTPPRRFNYPVQSNINISPRAESRVSFATLMALAESLDILAIVIERRKAELAALEWDIVRRDKDENLSDEDESIEAIKTMLRRPDGELDWNRWIRSVMHERFVTDAVTIEPVYDSVGKLQYLYQIAGYTIEPKVDERGRTPRAPTVAYQQIIQGVPSVDFAANQLIYFPYNVRPWSKFGYSPVEQIIIMINIALNREQQQLEYFTSGSVPESLLAAPETWGPQQIKEFQEYLDSYLAGNLAARSKLTVVPSGTKVFDTKDPVLKNEFDEWIARIVCFAFGISNTAFIKGINRAVAETAKDEAKEEGLEPEMNFIVSLMNRILEDCWKRPDLEFIWSDANQTDPEMDMTVATGYVKVGIWSVDEVRERQGLQQIGFGNAIFTAQGVVMVKDIISGNLPAPAGQGALPVPAGEEKPAEGTTPEPAAKLSQKKNKVLKKLPLPNSAAFHKSFKGVVLGVLKSAGDGVVKQIWKAIAPAIQKQTAKKTSGDDNAKLADETAAGLSLTALNAIPGKVKPILGQVASTAAAQALNQANGAGGGEAVVGDALDALLDQADEAALEWSTAHSAYMVGMKWLDGDLVPNPNAAYSITESTRTDLRSLIGQALNEGWTRDNLADKIQAGPFSEARADMIAQTELKAAHATANLLGWKHSGQVSGKQWLLSDDHSGDDECNDNADAGVIDLDDDFPSGDDTDPAHPNCECNVVAVLKEAGKDES